MKTIAFLLVSFFVSFFTHAQKTTTTQGIKITVTVPNVPGSNGDVFFGLYTQDTFMKAGPIKAESSIIKDGIATVIFKDIPQGEYAISCFYDANGNKRMDFEPNGMPKESYGVSNNNMSYGPPVWEDAKFVVAKEDLALTIRM